MKHCAAKCPSTGDSSSDSEINADCICDSNPSLTTNFEHLPAKQRTSIQCSQVDFIQLLNTLKQTASVHYPPVLQAAAFESSRQQSNHIHLARQSSDGDSEDILHVLKALRDPQEIYRARLLFASSAKLDLIQVSNSTIIKLTNFMFVSNYSYLYNQKRINDNNNASNRSINKNVDELDILNIDDGKKMNNIAQVAIIQALHLSRCGIDTIEEFAFAGLEFSLASLSLTNNKLSSIPSLALNNLIALKLLDLTNNNILSLNAFAFNNLHKLNTLRLADNNLGAITSIDDNAFEGLGDSLIDLSLKNCKLSSVPTNSFSKIINLEFLNLAQNNITAINANSFKPLKALSTLNLERNNIKEMDKASFAGIEISLSSLSLLANSISYYPSYQMATLRQLRRLDLGFNKLTELPSDAFTANSQLLLVALDGNELKTLPESAFTSVRNSLKGLSFGGKSIVCDCRLEWLVRWQAYGQLQVSSRERNPQFCAQPFRLRSLASFSDLNKELQNCNSKTNTLESIKKEIQASSSSQLPSGGLTTVSDIYNDKTTLGSRVTVDDDDLISAASTIKSYGQSSTATTTMRPISSILQTQKATRSQYGSRVGTDATMGFRFQDKTTQPMILKLTATTIIPRNDNNKNEARMTQKPSHLTTMSTVFQTTLTAQPSRITTQQVANQYSPEYRNQSTHSTTTSKIQHYIDMKTQRKVLKNGPSDTKLTILDKSIAKSQTVAPRFEDKFTFIPTTMLPQTTTTKMPQTTRQTSKLYNTQQPRLKLNDKNNTISTSTVRMQITEPVKFTIIKDQNRTKDITLKELKTLTDDNSFGSYVASSSPSIIRTLPPFAVPQPTSKIGSASEIQVDVDSVNSKNNSSVLPGNRFKDVTQPRISFSVSSSSISAKPSSSITSSATTTSIAMNKNIAGSKFALEKTVTKSDNQQTNNSRMSVSSMTRLMSLPIAVDQINASFSTTERAISHKEQSNHPTVELERLGSTPSVTLLSTSYITPNSTTVSRDTSIKKKRLDDSDSKPSLKTSSDILRLGVDSRLIIAYNTSRLNTEFDSHKLNLSQISYTPLKLTTLKPAGALTTTSTTTSTTSTTTSSPSFSDELDQRSLRAFYSPNNNSSLSVDSQDLISTQIHAQEVLKTNYVNEIDNKGKQQNSLLSRQRGLRKEDDDNRDSSLPEIAATTTTTDKDNKRLIDVSFANLPPFFNKLSRVIDVDKLALILATVLCAALLLIALTTICICCCCWQSSTSSQTKRKTMSSVGKNLTPFSEKLTVKRNTKRQTMSSSKAMSNSLLLQSDDTGDSNSSSASCMHVQMPSQQMQMKDRVSNKRINERLPTRSASLQLVPGKARPIKGTISPRFEQLDHVDGLRKHRAAHEQMNTTSSKPLFTTNLAGNSKIVKRSHSLAIENRLHSTKHNLDPETCSSELSSSSSLSCDSDKTNSPGANKNNHYNLSAAHKNFLVNNQTTDERSTCDLLQTIDEHGSEQQFKYSSQTKRQATNDGRGKVNSRKSLVKSSQYQPPAPPPPPPLPPIPVTQSNTANLALLQFVSNYPNILSARLSPLPTESLNGDYLSTELLPISAEDHWPSEPQADPSGVPNSLTFIGNRDNFKAQPADISDDDERNRQDEFLNDSNDKCWSSRQNKFNLDANWHTMAPHKLSSTPSNQENCTHMNCSIIHCSDYYTQPHSNHNHNERNSYMTDLNLLSPLPPRKLQHSQSTHRHRHKRNNHSHHQHSYNHHHQHHKQNKKNDENHPASIHSQNQDSNLANRQTYGAVNWLRWEPPPPPSMQQLHYNNN